MVDKNPELLSQEKERKDVTILFLDLEGYTKLSASRPEVEVNAAIEKMFSSFVDPIQRSHGDINETAGDILMGEETRKMVDGLWPVYHLGPVGLKGIKDPLPVFSLLRAP